MQPKEMLSRSSVRAEFRYGLSLELKYAARVNIHGAQQAATREFGVSFNLMTRSGRGEAGRRSVRTSEIAR